MLFDDLDITNYTPNMVDAIRANENVANDTTDIALRKLFTALYPSNISLDEVLIKCAVLNQLYSTNIFKVAASLKNYETYRQAIRNFQATYQLKSLSPRQQDKYLWQLGKRLK